MKDRDQSQYRVTFQIDQLKSIEQQIIEVKTLQLQNQFTKLNQQQQHEQQMKKTINLTKYLLPVITF